MNKILTAIAILLLPVLAFARGQETTVVTRTAYFPDGPGSIVVIRGQQGSFSPMGARTTRISSGKRKLSKAEMEAIRVKYKFPKGKFATSQSWTVISTKRKPF